MPTSRRVLWVAFLSIGPLMSGAAAQNYPVQSYYDLPPSARIIHIQRPLAETAFAQAEERDRRWIERCRPVIHRDRYGVGRYSYAARGCEFGPLE
jgi:hypothetical protein